MQWTTFNSEKTRHCSHNGNSAFIHYRTNPYTDKIYYSLTLYINGIESKAIPFDTCLEAEKYAEGELSK